jgi:hypothetical protein
MKNRRNYYRILHVQPEAPLEVIKASYRCMMTKLRHHPDLGGDHETAVLINQAYAVLSNPEQRKLYDQGIHLRKLHVVQRAHHASTPDTRADSGQRCATTHTPSPFTGQKTPSHASEACCLFCGASIIDAIHTDKRCSRCNSPVTPISNLKITAKRELFGRRTVPRMSKNEYITAYPSWPHQGLNARLRDVSPVGISFISDLAAHVDQVIKVSGSTFDGIVRVVSVRPGGSVSSVHGLFLTLLPTSKAGSFVSMRV